jgi:hypothetical protein
MKRPIAVIAFLVIVIFGLGLLLGTVVPRWFSPGAKPLTTATLLRQVKTLSHLVTVQYVIEKVIVHEDPRWYPGGENRVLLIAHGIVKAGLDLSKMQPSDLEISSNKVIVKLPPAEITDAYLDEKQTRIIEHSTGLLRAFDKDLQQTARQNAVADIHRAARNGGILKDADDRARAQLTHLFQQMGYEQVEFRR